MNPVNIISMPYNYRDALYEDDVDEDGEPFPPMPQPVSYADLPIQMPAYVLVITDRNGTPLAIYADGRQIRRQDVTTVWQGVLEYNADCVAREVDNRQ